MKNLPCLLPLAALAFLLGLSLRASAQTAAAEQPETDTDHYIPPAGQAPPVAPPLKKGSPLDHLVNDPKYAALPAGFHEGNTTGPYWIAHRHIDELDGQGWGWLRKSSDDWSDAKWITIQETPGLAIAPRRHLLAPNTDNDWEFKFWGSFASYKAYDPRMDELLPVFILRGYEVIGPAQPLRNKVGPPDRVVHKPSGASSRNNRPILTDPGVD